MENKVFDTNVDLDSTFLEAVYDNDSVTAAAIFQQYLQELPGDLHTISESFESGDKKLFLSVIHKKKVGFSYVGLTDVTTRMNELEGKCAASDNLQVFQSELKSVLDRINSSTAAIETVLKRLQQQEL